MLCELIRFGEDEAQRDLFFTGPLDEFQVDLLRFKPDIQQYEEAMKVFSPQNIVFNDFPKTRSLFLANARVPISREIDQIPMFVDDKMVDGLCFSWLIGSLR